MQLPPPPSSVRSGAPSHADPATVGPLDALRVLRLAGSALFVQASLHGQLLRIEWEQEKFRLLKMLAIAVLGYACVLCGLIFTGLLALALAWSSDYRMAVMLGLIAVYGLAASLAWRRFQALSALGSRSFSATREELSADVALLKSQL